MVVRNITILVPKQKYGITYERGSRIKAWINVNDTATEYCYPYTNFGPDEYELVIPDRAYADLLTSE